MLLDDIDRKTIPCGYGSPRARGRRIVSGVTANCFNRHCCYKRKAFAHASAAKQSIVRLSKKLDCFAALAMTAVGQSHVRILAARMRPRCENNFRRSHEKGVGNAGCRRTRSLACKVKKHTS